MAFPAESPRLFSLELRPPCFLCCCYTLASCRRQLSSSTTAVVLSRCSGNSAQSFDCSIQLRPFCFQLRQHRTQISHSVHLPLSKIQIPDTIIYEWIVGEFCRLRRTGGNELFDSTVKSSANHCLRRSLGEENKYAREKALIVTVDLGPSPVCRSGTAESDGTAASTNATSVAQTDACTGGI